jgi:N-acetyltransferase
MHAATGATFVEPVTLTGRHVVLHPLSQAHAPELAKAAAEGDLYQLWYTKVPHPDRVSQEIDRRLGLLQLGHMLPFSVQSTKTGQMVGMTTYMAIDAPNRRLEIGSTWYAPSVQRTPLNTECKLLLLQHAFERLRCIAVEFRTSFFNRQSRTAIERLGAKLDGILRSHMIMDNGTVRDTVVYSVIESEWPAVKAHLQFLLEPNNPHRTTLRR